MSVRFKSSHSKNHERNKKRLAQRGYANPVPYRAKSKPIGVPKRQKPKEPRKLTEPLDKFPSYLIGNPQAKAKFLQSQGIHKSQPSENRQRVVTSKDIYQEEVIDSTTPRPPPEPKVKSDRPKSAPTFGVTPAHGAQVKKTKKNEKGKREDSEEEKQDRRKPEKKMSSSKNTVVENKNKPKSEEVLDADVSVPDEIIVKKSEHDMRLDRFLVHRFPNLPNSLIQRFIREKKITVSEDRDEDEVEESVGSRGRKASANERVSEGQIVYLKIKHIKLGQQESNNEEVSPNDLEYFKSLILYRDRYIMAINKPCGLACQGGSGVRDHVDRYLPYFKSSDGEETAKLAHRLDKDTSGVLLIARTRGVAIKLQEMFKGHKDVAKTYWAFVDGMPEPEHGVIKVPIEKTMQNGEEKVVVQKSLEGKAKISITDYKTLYAGESGSLLAMYPKTGRTHQLRVHCASVLNTPIIGDSKYGNRESSSSFYHNLDLHLHARKLVFNHPETLERMELIAPLPPHMKKTLTEFNLGENFVD